MTLAIWRSGLGTCHDEQRRMQGAAPWRTALGRRPSSYRGLDCFPRQPVAEVAHHGPLQCLGRRCRSQLRDAGGLRCSVRGGGLCYRSGRRQACHRPSRVARHGADGWAPPRACSWAAISFRSHFAQRVGMAEFACSCRWGRCHRVRASGSAKAGSCRNLRTAPARRCCQIPWRQSSVELRPEPPHANGHILQDRHGRQHQENGREKQRR